MRPEVNLLAADLLPPVERLPLSHLGLALGGWVLVLSAVSAHDSWKLRGARADVDVAAAVSARARAEVAHLAASSRHDAEKHALDRQLEQLVGQRGARLATLQTLEREAGTRHPSRFSDYFTGVAEAHVPGLWITGVAIDFKDDRLQIQGSAQQPAAVPGFLHLLRGHPAFAGSALDGIDVKSNDDGNVGFEVRGVPG